MPKSGVQRFPLEFGDFPLNSGPHVAQWRTLPRKCFGVQWVRLGIYQARLEKGALHPWVGLRPVDAPLLHPHLVHTSLEAKDTSEFALVA